MSRQLSIERVLAELKGRIEEHRRKAAFHAEQEAFHQKEKVRHTEDLQNVLERFETFQAAADAVSELVARPREEKAADDSIPAGKGAVLSKLVERVVVAKGPIEPFGATDITPGDPGALRGPAREEDRRPRRCRQAPPPGPCPADPPAPPGPCAPRGAVQPDPWPGRLSGVYALPAMSLTYLRK